MGHGLEAARASIAVERAAGGFMVPVALSLPGPDAPEADQLLARHALVLALRQAGYEAHALARHVVEVRIRAGGVEYRAPGRRGAWARRDPQAAELDERQRRYLAALTRVMRPHRMGPVRAAKADAKAERDAVIVEAYEALGLVPRPVPLRSRASLVAAQLGCTARHVRSVVAAWREKGGTG